MGIIDPFSEYSLYDIISGDLGFSDRGNGFKQPEGSVDFYALHVLPTNDDGDYMVQYDGHVGKVDSFSADEYDDVLELVDDLMTHIFEIQARKDDDEALVEYAGKFMTNDEEQAEAQPDIYQHVPENV